MIVIIGGNSRLFTCRARLFPFRLARSLRTQYVSTSTQPCVQ
jgi:hypothetical protein